MEYILLHQVFTNNGKVFSFPQDLSKLLESEVPAFLAVELQPNLFDWLEIDRDILTNTIMANKPTLYYEINREPGQMDPYEWALYKANKESLWIKKEDTNKLLSSNTENKKISNGSKSDNHTIEILQAAVQLLSEELINLKASSKLIKEEKGNFSLSIISLTKEISDHSHRWWETGTLGKPPFGKAESNIEKNISEAMKFKNKPKS